MPKIRETPISVGDVSGRLTVMSDPAIRNPDQRRLYDCVCVCGKAVRVSERTFTSGKYPSCGCWWREAKRSPHRSPHKIKHGACVGGAHLPEYDVWQAMKWRCLNPQCKAYRDYGGRGIKVCDEWAGSFECFITDMGRRPGPEYTLERKNNEGNYESGNCAWVTRREQYRNRRSNVFLAANGETRCIVDWAADLKCSGSGLTARIKRGDSPEEAIEWFRRRRDAAA